MNAGNVYFTPACRDDVPSVVNLHIQAFPGFFLTSLGPAFLETMYHVFLSSTGCVFLVARDADTIHGFAVGVLKSAGKDRYLALRFIPKFIVSLLPPVARNPIAVSHRLISSFFDIGEPLAIPDDASVLRSIAVAPRWQGTGVAQTLLRQFENSSYRKGARSVALTTDVVDNIRAIAFYNKNDYKVVQTFKQSKRRNMFLMVKNLVGFDSQEQGIRE